MKILLTGADNYVGKAVLDHLLKLRFVTAIFCIINRPLGFAIPETDKDLHVIYMKDMTEWIENVNNLIKDAEAMIWAMGATTGNVDANYNFPISFQENFRKIMDRRDYSRFVSIFVSDQYATPDQSAKLLCRSSARKIKGLYEAASIAFAADNYEVWQSFIVRAGWILPRKIGSNLLMKMLGAQRAIYADELAAFLGKLAVRGIEGEEVVFCNEAAAEEGRETLVALHRPITGEEAYEAIVLALEERTQ